MTFFQESQETVHGPGANWVDKSLEFRSQVICFGSFASSLCCPKRWVEDGLRFESEHKHVQTTMVDCRGVPRFVLQDAMKVNDHTEETRSCTLRVRRSFEDLVQCSTLWLFERCVQEYGQPDSQAHGELLRTVVGSGTHTRQIVSGGMMYGSHLATLAKNPRVTSRLCDG